MVAPCQLNFVDPPTPTPNNDNSNHLQRFEQLFIQPNETAYMTSTQHVNYGSDDSLFVPALTIKTVVQECLSRVESPGMLSAICYLLVIAVALYIPKLI